VFVSLTQPAVNNVSLWSVHNNVSAHNYGQVTLGLPLMFLDLQCISFAQWFSDFCVSSPLKHGPAPARTYHFIHQLSAVVLE